MVAPNVQTRSQEPRDWGNYASPSVLPNTPGFIAPLDKLQPLQVGDTASVLNQGRWVCDSTGTLGGGTAVWLAECGRTQGFQSSATADNYASTVVGDMPGADDFIVTALCMPFNDRNTSGNQIIAENVLGSTGWRIAWIFGTLSFSVFDSLGNEIAADAGASDYDGLMAKGRMHVLTLRARQAGGVLSVEGWCGPARIASPSSSAAAGMSPAVAGTLQLGQGVGFTTVPLDGAVFGLGYFEGTVTDDVLRQVQGDALMCGTLPIVSPIAYTRQYCGYDLTQGAPSGASWPACIGGIPLARQGTPSGCRGYFPAV